MMGDIGSLISALPLSWSALLIFLIAGMAYYWFSVHPKVIENDDLREIIDRVIPQIGSDITLMEKSIEDFRDLKGLPSLLEVLKDSLGQINGLQEMHLQLENVITTGFGSIRSIMTEERDRNRFSRGSTREPLSREPSFSQRPKKLDDMNVEDIKALLQSGSLREDYSERKKEEGLSLLKRAIRYIGDERQDDDLFERSLLKRY